MFNNTLMQLERERKNKILNLKPEEVELYIDSLNRRMAAAYGNVSNNFTHDIEASTKAADLCDEVVELLKKKYPNVSTYTAWSRVDILVDKLRETANDVHDEKLKKAYHNLSHEYLLMSKELIILKYIMGVYYDFYSYRGKYDNIFHIIDKTALDTDDKRKVVNALDELPRYELYNQYYMDNMDIILQLMIKMMDADYELLKKASDFTIDDETTDDTFFNEFRRDMLELQELSKDLLKEYDAYMDDGFHNAKETERKILCEMWHDNSLYKDGHCKDKDYVDYIQYNRPSYDLKTMTFIPSQYELDMMAAFKES